MWVCLSLLSALCLLPGGGAESQGGGPRCQPAPDWKIGEASKMDSLRQKLEGQGLMNINYMVVNDQNMQAQRLHPLLTTRLSSNIQLYKQGDQDANVWHALKGEKDDFLVYDRCGRLTYHISLPYSIIGQGHVETAIKDTYCKRICGNCSHESVDVPEECSRPVEARPEEAAAAAAAGGAGTRVEEEAGHGDGHGRGHHAHDHGHHHGHHGHGDQQGVAHGQHHGNGNHHGDRGQHQHDVSQQRPADDADFLLLLSGDQRAVAPGPQEVQGAAVMRRP
ncbi:hypothetical protein NHX12_028678 [Muraenolepis orangiensis]|uniref:Selenoprotein P N-terminal domain-containing protein n=1 Tax=Muraenolepis orangiensis TaxID=630683 RepID=A0A9Q0E9W0_9TELE|nr:hypothetical protein NHX12_028678 [Muraenolepis orangiensis]